MTKKDDEEGKESKICSSVFKHRPPISVLYPAAQWGDSTPRRRGKRNASSVDWGVTKTGGAAASVFSVPRDATIISSRANLKNMTAPRTVFNAIPANLARRKETIVATVSPVPSSSTARLVRLALQVRTMSRRATWQKRAQKYEHKRRESAAHRDTLLLGGLACFFCSTALHARAAGKYSPQAIEDDCIECPGGFYTNGILIGASECLACEAGSKAEPGALNCSACEPGTFSLGQAVECDDCPNGTYSSNFGTET